MRPAERNKLDSLYFNYPHFHAPDPATREKHQNNAPVAIVGAGPIGMTAALALAKEGVRSVVFDNKSSFNDGSRAICVARPSFYIMQQIGAIAPFLEKSLPWTTGRTFYRGQQILEFKMPDGPDEKFRPMYNLQQQYIEQFLWQKVEACELVDIRWQSEVVGLKDTTEGARLTVADPAGEYLYDADWVLACDGARSPVRTMRGLRLKGENFEGRYVIADIQMDHDYPTIRRALFDPSSRPGGTVLVHKEPDNIWRIDYQLEDDESADEALREENVRNSVTAVLKDIDYEGSWELEWWSVYSANTLALDDYRDGRVFYVGDSAHIVPIFGVRGLNNGLADAANIGWKLGWVLNGKAGNDLLDSYTPERRGATLDVFANATKSARFMTPQTHGWKLMRDAALSLALTHPFAGELANPRQMTPFTYSESPAVLSTDEHANHSGFTGGPEVGAFMPDVKLNEASHHDAPLFSDNFPAEFLSDLLGRGFTALCFDTRLAQQIKESYAQQLDENASDDCLTVVTLAHPSAIATKFAASAHSVYLIRPDMHIAARWFNTTASAVIRGFCSVTFQVEAKL